MCMLHNCAKDAPMCSAFLGGMFCNNLSVPNSFTTLIPLFALSLHHTQLSLLKKSFNTGQINMAFANSQMKHGIPSLTDFRL